MLFVMRSRPPKFYTETDGRVYIHPKSVNNRQSDYSSKHVIYHTKVKSGKVGVVWDWCHVIALINVGVSS